MKKQTHLDKIIDKYKLVLISQHCSDKLNVYKTPHKHIYVRDYTPSVEGEYLDTKMEKILIFFYSEGMVHAEISVSYEFLLDSKFDTWEYIVTELELQISELK